MPNEISAGADMLNDNWGWIFDIFLKFHVFVYIKNQILELLYILCLRIIIYT